jgi:DnaJ-domain-containing protein 1
MNRRLMRAIKQRYLAAVRKGHWAKASYLKRYMQTVAALTRETANGR